jgi:N-ethylmaleimide reductase
MTDCADPLFEPVRIGALLAPNRIFMAPLTRSRASDPGGVPTQMMADYYAQRASAGLIISEATNISEVARGYAWTPGIYTDAQVSGWRMVTRAVHAAGGRIFCQLWHVGRVSHVSLHPGQDPVSASAVPCAECTAYVEVDGVGRRIPASPPRALTADEVRATCADYAAAAARAIEAGFDGVEVHGANGYLLQQFAAPNVNNRDDEYGGSVANRARFHIEAVSAAAEAIGADRVGLRLSPVFGFSGIADPDPGPVHRAIAEAASQRGIAFLHLADTGTMAPGAEPRMHEVLELMRGSFDGPVVLNGGYDAGRARHEIATGEAAAVAFGRAFLANPDLPRRLAQGLPLNPPEPATFYGGDQAGYTDYPTWTEG